MFVFKMLVGSVEDKNIQNSSLEPKHRIAFFESTKEIVNQEKSPKIWKEISFEWSPKGQRICYYQGLLGVKGSQLYKMPKDYFFTR